MQNYSCESILGAVGRVLDDARVRRFAIRDAEDGLIVETFDSNGDPQLTINVDLSDLANLVEQTSRMDAAPRYERSYGHDESTLTAFLERHMLVGAGR
jgi:hypothetical protein